MSYKESELYDECSVCNRKLVNDTERFYGVCAYCIKEHIDGGKAFRQKIYFSNAFYKRVFEKRIRFANMNYRAGVAFERRLKHLLEDHGHVVFRSAGSHGAADLVSIKDGVTYLWQCKRDFRPLSDAETANLLAPCKTNECNVTSKCNNETHYYKYIVPVHAKLFNRVLSLTDLRTNKDITSEVFT